VVGEFDVYCRAKVEGVDFFVLRISGRPKTSLRYTLPPRVLPPAGFFDVGRLLPPPDNFDAETFITVPPTSPCSYRYYPHRHDEPAQSDQTFPKQQTNHPSTYHDPEAA
jgi:hypothetical protein